VSARIPKIKNRNKDEIIELTCGRDIIRRRFSVRSIIFKGALVLTLGVASGALAQTEILKKDPTQQTETQQTQSVTSSPKHGKHRGQSDTLR
jgi:hypothetical protein